MWTPRTTETSQRQQPRFIKDLKGRQQLKWRKGTSVLTQVTTRGQYEEDPNAWMTRGSLKSRLGGQKAGHQGSSSYPKEFQLHPKGQQKICSCFSLENDRGAVGGKRRGCWITSGRETSHPPAEALPQEPRGTLAPSFTPLLPHCTEHPAPFNQPRMQHAQERLLFFPLSTLLCVWGRNPSFDSTLFLLWSIQCGSYPMWELLLQQCRIPHLPTCTLWDAVSWAECWSLGFLPGLKTAEVRMHSGRGAHNRVIHPSKQQYKHEKYKKFEQVRNKWKPVNSVITKWQILAFWSTLLLFLLLLLSFWSSGDEIQAFSHARQALYHEVLPNPLC